MVLSISWDNNNSLNGADTEVVDDVFEQDTEASLYADFTIHWLGLT